MYEDDLDRHVEEVLSKRAKIRRSLRGVWAFVKTRRLTIKSNTIGSDIFSLALGMITAFYGFCVGKKFVAKVTIFVLTSGQSFGEPPLSSSWLSLSTCTTQSSRDFG